MRGRISGEPTRRAGPERLALGVMVLAAALLVSATSGPRVARAAPASPTAWTAPVTIPGSSSIGSPALAEFNGKLYAAWTGSGGSGVVHVWYSSFNGTTWTKPAKVPSALTIQYSTPALGVYNGALFFAWVSSATPNQQLWYSSFNGTTWAHQKKVPSGLTRGGTGGSLAAYNGKLYLGFEGTGTTSKIWYTAFNGTSWTATTTIPSVTNAFSPGLAVYNGALYASWDDQTSREIVYTAYNGTSWTSPASLASSSVFDGPALAAIGGILYDAWIDFPIGGGFGDVTYAAFNGTSWSADVSVPSSLSCNGMGIGAYGSSLYAAWTTADCGNPGGVNYSTGP
jgi:hypothetical protein